MSSQPCERHRWSRPSPTCLSLLLLVTMATGGPCPQVSNPNCRCLTSSSSTSTPPDVTCIFSSPHPHQPPIFADSPAIKLALGTLDLSHNALESLPPDFLQGIQTVERLSLRNNCLTHIPPVLRGLGGVTSLDLSYNCLTGLPLTTGAALSGLEILDLSGNKMEVLLADRHQETTTTRDLQFKSLRLLNLSCNAIQRIEGRVFSPMRHLVTLDLSRNRLREVTDAMFSWLTLSLSCLDLSHNLLRHLQPSSLRHLQHLRALSLAHNDNLWVEGVRFPAHMRSVDLSHCALTFLDHCQLTALPDLAFIGLRGNHLHCTCQLYLLLQWYQEQHHKSGRTMDADHTGTNWTCTTASTTTTTSIIGEMGDQREEVGRVQYVHDLWQCQDTESHCQTLEHTLHHLTGQSQMSVMLDVASSGSTLLSSWTLHHSGQVPLDGFRLHYLPEDGTPTISPLIPPDARSEVLHLVEVRRHFLVCLDVLAFHQTSVLHRTCRNFKDESQNIISGVLAACVFLVPCFTTLVYVSLKDRQIHNRLTHHRCSAEKVEDVEQCGATGEGRAEGNGMSQAVRVSMEQPSQGNVDSHTHVSMERPLPSDSYTHVSTERPLQGNTDSNIGSEKQTASPVSQHSMTSLLGCTEPDCEGNEDHACGKALSTTTTASTDLSPTQHTNTPDTIVPSPALCPSRDPSQQHQPAPKKEVSVMHTAQTPKEDDKPVD